MKTSFSLGGFFFFAPLFLATSCGFNPLERATPSSAASGQKLVNLFVGSDGYGRVSFLSCVGGIGNLITEAQLNEYLSKGGRVVQASNYQTVGSQSQLGHQRCTSRPILVDGKKDIMDELTSANSSSYQSEVERVLSARQAQLDFQKKINQEAEEAHKKREAEIKQEADADKLRLTRELESAL